MSFLNDVLNKLKKQDGNSDSNNDDEGIGQRERGRQPAAESSEKKQETEKAEKREQPSLYEWRPGEKEQYMKWASEYEKQWAREHSPDQKVERTEKADDDERVR